ncbi:MAG: outer membrane protein assembly factor BamD [Gammaproteobacteria bacterium]
MNAVKTLALACLSCALCACAGSPDSDPEGTQAAGELYREAKAALDRENYEIAVEKYETLEARFPFGRFALQAQLESAYAYYKSSEPDAAISNADRFIKLHPQHPNIAYAYYLKGLANFDRGASFLDSFLPRQPSDNDPSPLQRSFDDFAVVVQNYPGSRYAQDARQRMVYLRNELAKHELKVASYYMRRGAYVAAANRAKFVLDNLPGAESTPDALVTMVKAYRELGLNDLASDTLRILQANYPDQASAL